MDIWVTPRLKCESIFPIHIKLQTPQYAYCLLRRLQRFSFRLHFSTLPLALYHSCVEPYIRHLTLMQPTIQLLEMQFRAGICLVTNIVSTETLPSSDFLSHRNIKYLRTKYSLNYIIGIPFLIIIM